MSECCYRKYLRTNIYCESADAKKLPCGGKNTHTHRMIKLNTEEWPWLKSEHNGEISRDSGPGAVLSGMFTSLKNLL